MTNIYPLGYYVYAYIRNKDSIIAKVETLYYIGKGSNDRAWLKHHHNSFPTNKWQIIILESNLSEIGAFALERFYIRWYGRIDLGTGILRNLTNGGDGVSGHKHTEISKIKMSKALTGRSLSESHKLNLSISKTGKPGHVHTEKHKLYMKQSMTGRTGSIRSNEAKIKTSITLNNRTTEQKEETRRKKKIAIDNQTLDQREITRKKKSQSSKNRIRIPHSQETKNRISEAAKKRLRLPHSEETKQKIRESNQKTASLKVIK